jgi:exportin-1
VAQGFIPHILDPIIGDYKRNIAGARDPEVLTLFATVVEKLKTNVVEEVPRVMAAIFEVTLDMITKNFEDFPEHRIRFFEFLKAVNQFCFPALFNIPPDHQRLVVHAVVWAMKHTERNISDTVSPAVGSIAGISLAYAHNAMFGLLTGIGDPA